MVHFYKFSWVIQLNQCLIVSENCPNISFKIWMSVNKGTSILTLSILILDICLNVGKLNQMECLYVFKCLSVITWENRMPQSLHTKSLYMKEIISCFHTCGIKYQDNAKKEMKYWYIYKHRIMNYSSRCVISWNCFVSWWH